MTAPEVLRERVRQRMRELSLRPADLNRLVGRSAAWARGFLNGEQDVPVDLLDRLSEVLDVPVPSLFDESQLNSPQWGTSEAPDIDDPTEGRQDASAPPAHPQRSEGSMTREEAATLATLQSLQALPIRVQRKIFSAIDQYATRLKASSYPAETTSGKRRRRGGSA